MLYTYKGFLLQQAILSKSTEEHEENRFSILFSTELKLSVNDYVIIDDIRYIVAELNYIIDTKSKNTDKINVEILLVYRYWKESKGMPVKGSLEVSYLDKIKRNEVIDSDLGEIMPNDIIEAS